MDKHLLRNIVNNSYNMQELNQFLHHCVSTVSARLKSLYFRKKLYFPFITDIDKDIHDFAIDICIPLFARNEQGVFYILKTYFLDKLDEKNLSPEKSAFYLNRLLFSHTHQELIKQFQIHDPAGWRIYRNLGMTVERSPNISSAVLTGKTYFYYNHPNSSTSFPSDYFPQLPEIDLYSLKQLISEQIKSSLMLPDVVKNVLYNCSQQDSWRKFISRSKLFTALKDVMTIKTVDFNNFRFEDSSLKINGGLDSDPDVLIKVVTSRVKSEILHYLKKKKIDEQTGPVYKTLIQNYFTDLIQYGEVAKLGDYMKKLCPDLLMSDTIWLPHRNRIEYLIKLGKKHLRQELSEIPDNDSIQKIK